MATSLEKVTDNLPQLMKQLKELASADVLVGVPQETADRKEVGSREMNNATLAYIHDNGSPAANIPARPFMRPGIQAAKASVAKAFLRGALRALDGNSDALNIALHEAGLIAQRSIRAIINQGIPPPLADSTLKARIRSGKAAKGAKAELESRAEGNEPSTATAKPLIQTGQLRNSINYVIRKR
jgi:hypothetical protein